MGAIYQFAGIRFDPKGGVLTSGGKSTTLRPRTAAVLACLLERPRALVPKEDLLRQVWPDLIVTENSLAQCIKEIRRELADADERLVRTVHRRGYVLEATAERLEPALEAARPRGIGRRLSLMVLPLATVGGDPEHHFFAEGLSEDLTTDLGGIPGTFVISRGTAQTFAGRQIDARAIGRELGVAYLLEGSVRRADDEIVVNLALIDTRDARQVWVERFEGRRVRLGALQRLMTGQVVQRVHYELMHAESDRAELAADPDAHDLATRAWSLYNRSLPEVPAEVGALIERALALDPDCVLALASLAGLRINEIATRKSADPARNLDEAEEAVRKVLARDPEHRTVNKMLAIVFTYREQFEEALGALQRQMSLNPNLSSAHHWTGVVHILMGNAGLAIEPGEMALELSPRDARLSTYIRNIALAHLHLANDAEALVVAERSVHMPNPWPRSYETLAAAYAVNGLLEEARAAVKVLMEKWPGYSIDRHRAEMISHRPAFVAQRERLLDGLRRAGLPER